MHQGSKQNENLPKLEFEEVERFTDGQLNTVIHTAEGKFGIVHSVEQFKDNRGRKQRFLRYKDLDSAIEQLIAAKRWIEADKAEAGE